MWAFPFFMVEYELGLASEGKIRVDQFIVTSGSVESRKT